MCPRLLRMVLAALAGGATFLACASPTAHAVPDTMAQRMQACTACHGQDGVATNQGYFPRIAGKPVGYLYNQLVNFREGRRGNRVMSALTEHMSDAYLMEIATYFASLELPYPAVPGQVPDPQVMARGAALVNRGDAARQLPACVQCHGAQMTGGAPAIPGLLGLSKAYLTAQFGAWRTGQRRSAAPDCMREISQRLTPDDLVAVAAYLVSQPVPHGRRPAASLSSPPPMDCGSGVR
jgi:cytochrome c553